MSEVSTLSKNAARGAGLGWGMAIEAAEATVWLARYALPGPTLLARLLQRNEYVASGALSPSTLSGVWSALSGSLCPLLTGATLSDCALRFESGEGIEMAGITEPLLLVPFAASVALTNKQAVGVEWRGVTILTDGHLLHIAGDQSDVEAQCVSSVKCSVQVMLDGNAPGETRVQIDAGCWSVLSAFAQLSYAPATELSRLLGAGAGSGDND